MCLLKSLSTVVVFLTSMVAGQTKVKHACMKTLPNICYDVYSKGNAAISQQTANQSCISMGESLAAVTSQQTQTLMMAFAGELNGQAWVAGRTLPGRWQSEYATGGSVYRTASVPGDNAVDKTCSTLSLATNGLQAVTCSSSVGRRAMCQYPLVEGAVCGMWGSNISNICYVASRDTTYKTYQEAKQFCEYYVTGTTNSRSTLAYTEVDSKLVKDFFMLNYKNPDISKTENNELWVSYKRLPDWYWFQGSSATLASYENWKTGHPDTSLTEACMTLDLMAQSTWTSRRCDETVTYYICTGVPATTTTTTTTTSTTTTATTTTTAATTTTTTTPTTTTTTAQPSPVTSYSATVLPTTVSQGPGTTPTTISIATTDNTTEGVFGVVGSIGELNGTPLVLVIVSASGGFLFLIGILVAIYVSCRRGGSDEGDEEDSEIKVKSEVKVKSDIYMTPDKPEVPPRSNGMAVAQMKGVVHKHRVSRVKAANIHNIFIDPAYGAGSSGVPELYARSVNSQTLSTDGYPIVKDDASYVSKPASSMYSGRSVVTLQSMASGAHSASNQSPPMSQAIRRTEPEQYVSRIDYQPEIHSPYEVDDDIPPLSPPPPPLSPPPPPLLPPPPSLSTPPSSLSPPPPYLSPPPLPPRAEELLMAAPSPPSHTPRSASPAASQHRMPRGSMGRPDLANDNMMF